MLEFVLYSVVIIPPLNSNYRQIWLIIEEEGIGSSTALFLKIINMFLIRK